MRLYKSSPKKPVVYGGRNRKEILLIGCCCGMNKGGMGKRGGKNLICRNADFFAALVAKKRLWDWCRANPFARGPNILAPAWLLAESAVSEDTG